MTSSAAATPLESVPVSPKDQVEIQDIYLKLRNAEAKLVSPGGKAQVLPPSLYSFLCTLLADLKNGYSVVILQSNASLTTVEASKLLGVSRTHLIGLLEKGEIPFHKVGTHRRTFVRDVFAYKAKRDMGRRRILDDLARAEYDEGIYDKVPNDIK